MKQVAGIAFGLLLIPGITFAQTTNAATLASLFAEVEQLAAQINAIEAQVASTTPVIAPTCSITATPDLSLTQSNSDGQLAELGFTISWTAPDATSGSIMGGDTTNGSSWTADANPPAKGSLNDTAPAYFEHTYEFTGSFVEPSGIATCVGTLFLFD